MKSPRRLGRALRLCLMGLLVLLLLAGGATWLAHRHLTRLVVEAVNRSFPELHLSAKTVAFASAGQLDLKDVRLRVRRDGSEALFIPSARVRFSWRELRRKFVREIVIDQPRVRVGDALLAAFGKRPADEATASAPWRAGRLAINGGTALVEVSGQPAISGGFEVRYADAAAPAENRLALKALRIRVPGETTDALALSSLTLTATPDDLRRRTIRELALESPRLHLTDPLLALLPKTSSASDGAPWRVERLRVRDGKMRVDLAAWPEAEFDFALSAEQVAAEGGGAVELDATALRARWRGEGEDTLTFSSLRLAGTLAGLRRGIVQQIALDDAGVKVTDRVLAWRPPGSLLEGGAPSPPTSPQSAGADGAAPSNVRPWKIGRLAIKRGQARIDLAGAPLAEFAFGARLENASASEAAELQSIDVLDFALRTRQSGVEPFLRIPAIRAEFRVPELLHDRRLARVRVEHLDFRYGAAFRELIASGAKPALPEKPAAAEKAAPYIIGELRLTDGRIHFDDLGLGIPGIECRVETTFRELALAADAGAGGHELQTIELSQIALRSPLDPFFTVLELDSVFVRFTLAGMWKREIEEVAIVRPTLAIGPDLFWYVDRVQQNQAAPSAPPAIADDGPAWAIRRFSATSGQLVLALEGQAKLALPMPFESYAENLNFRRLSDLRLKLNIDMPEQDYDYPGYELGLRGVSGRVEFSLPPRQGSNNVVNTLRLRDVRWKNFRGRDVFLDVTYDERGIYGNLTGKGYTGIMRSQFNFLLTPQSDWNGWVSGTHIDLGGITKVLAPEKFSLTGPADFRLTVAAQARDIQSVKGDFVARGAGAMSIGKLNDLIRELPGDWSSVKRAVSRIGLETLRDFAYDTAHGDFQFTGLTGVLHLDLRGPAGSRKIDMNFHETTAPAPARRVAARRP